MDYRRVKKPDRDIRGIMAYGFKYGLDIDCYSKKVKYNSTDSAKRMVDYINQSNIKKGINKKARYYFCKKCLSYHITSKPERNEKNTRSHGRSLRCS